MKEHMSITLDATVAHHLRRYALQERRSVSGVAELAIETYLARHVPPASALVTTPGAFRGYVDRADAYGER